MHKSRIFSSFLRLLRGRTTNVGLFCGAGFTLIEVVIASGLLAMVAITSAKILLSAASRTKIDKVRYEAIQEAARLKEELKNYVTADPAVTRNAPGSPPWHLPADTSCRDCWALREGRHDVSSRLSSEMRRVYRASLSYTVAAKPWMGREILDVKIEVNWSAATPQN